MIKKINFSEVIDILSYPDRDSIVASSFANIACHHINLSCRSAKGLKEKLEVGEKLISTSTLYWVPIFNGDSFEVISLGEVRNININLPGQTHQTRLELQSAKIKNSISNEEFQIQILLDHLYCPKPGLPDEWKRALLVASKYQDSETEIPLYLNPMASPGLFRFGDAITGHKLQGSEYDSVILVTKSLNRLKTTNSGRAWAYTVMTRAKKNLYICEVPWA